MSEEELIARIEASHENLEMISGHKGGVVFSAGEFSGYHIC